MDENKSVCEKFAKGDKTLVFFGSVHGSDLSQIKYILDEINLLNPEIILIEGGFEKATFPGEQESIEKAGELGFVSYLAKKRKILMIGGEPSEKECVSFVEKNYERDSAFFYFALKSINNFFKIKLKINFTIDEKINMSLNQFKQNSDWNDYDYSFAHFQNVFRRFADEEFSPENDYADFFNILPDKSVSNEISKKLESFKDDFLLDKIKNAMQANNHIFVIKGKDCLSRIKDSLDEIFEK